MAAPANANTLPDTTNPSLILIGYLVDFEKISTLQTRHRYESPTLAHQAAIEAAIVANMDEQFASLKKLFIANAACEKCHQSPLVAGSVHQNFANAETQTLWDNLVDIVDELKTCPLDIKQVHMDFVKRSFEQLETAYRHDNVAAAGLC
ncbi:hypothetical protein BKA61DRAFT_676490 [Leptodontidium sp. MPI-SDFR-AT-0119]|nr:hypothetical protein BKA61DRAFT_676490 [Leptodontidium sp. MPI-SDFR-AT-0119]